MSEQKINLKQSRFSDAPWFQKEGSKTNSVQVCGAGGIGSWLTALLSRAGFKVYLYDFDLVEEHNMAGQLFTAGSIGLSKVDAVADMVAALIDSDTVVRKNEKVTEDTPVGKLCFSAFDNMEARKILFTKWKKQNLGVASSIFIDGRLNAEQYQVICITGDNQENIDKYEKELLFSDSEAAELSCTFKQTTHVAAAIAAQMVIFFTNFIANLQEGNNARKVPFYHEYLGPVNMLIKNL